MGMGVLTASAVQVIRQLNVDGEVLELRIRQTVLARHVVGDLELLEGAGVARLIQITLVGAGAVGVHLVDGDCDGRALGDLGHAVGCQLILSLLANVDVAVELGAPAAVHDVLRDLGIADDDAVLLARVDLGAVSCNVFVDWVMLVG